VFWNEDAERWQVSHGLDVQKDVFAMVDSKQDHARREKLTEFAD
jgi:hypothetical protein